ncbi:HK97 family phage prohead protease [Nocardia sp. NPDC058058]|uniref:HK97 family phage prohead protease n=1 Tax=Nocardia sp. NPDC058058 TaxID=3346317 RepID=UPI0036D92E8E
MTKNLKPYGDVAYADPGYLADGVHRFPLDTKAHVMGGWSYLGLPQNQRGYTAEQLENIRAEFRTAAANHGVQISGDTATFADLASRGAVLGVREVRAFPAQYEVRSMGNDKFELTGYASTTEQPYKMYDMFGEYTEVVRAGAFSKTLATSPDTNFLTNHGGLTLARTKNGTLKLSEDSGGLLTSSILDTRRSDAQDLMLAIERGDVDEMSMGFRVDLQKWSPDYDERSLVDINLERGDVSAVNYGANPNTSITAVQRAFNTVDAARMHDLANELRTGDLSPQSRRALAQVLDRAASDGDVRSNVQATTPMKSAPEEPNGFVPLNRHMMKRMALSKQQVK